MKNGLVTEKTRNALGLLKKLCREKGVPVTVQRQVILGALADRLDHPTADQVFEDVSRKLPGLSRTTVYRVLETLVEWDVIHKASHLGSAARYDPNVERHHHLTCLVCHKVVDVEDEAVRPIEFPRPSNRGFEITDYSVHFQGTCPECSKKVRKSKAS